MLFILLPRQLGEQEVLKNQNVSKLESSDSITIELNKENELYRYCATVILHS